MSFSKTAFALLVLIGMGLVLAPSFAYAELQLMWSQTYRVVVEPSRYDAFFDVVVDADDNAYVTGYTEDGAGLYQGITAKYAPDGTVLWTRDYASGGGGDGEVNLKALALAEDGYVYAVGTAEGDADEFDALLLKYSANGSFQWASTFETPDDLFEEFYLVKFDESGNIYCGGRSERTATGWDARVIKYDTDGDLLKAFSAGNVTYDAFLTDFAVKSNGVVLMSTLVVTRTGTTSFDAGLYAFAGNGLALWTEYFSGSGSDFFEVGASLVLDANGDIFMASSLSNATMDPALHYIDAAHSTVWTETFDAGVDHYETLANMDDFFYPRIDEGTHNMVRAAGGDFYLLANDWWGEKAQPDMQLLKVDADGNLVWRYTFDGPAGGEDIANDLAVNSEDTVFVTGQIETATAPYGELALLEIDADGNLVDVQEFDGAYDAGVGFAITLDSDGNPIVAGSLYAEAAYWDATIVKFCHGCVINDVCYADGTVNPTESCLVCDVSASTTLWSDADGDTCEDDLFCNGADTCGSGTCSVHAGDPCDEGETCNDDTDTCDPAGDDDDDDDDDDDNDDNDDDDDDDNDDNDDDDDNDDTTDDDVTAPGGDDDDDSGGSCG
jgi:hypothetical protein